MAYVTRGEPDCGMWVKNGPQQGYRFWLIGFLSGLNASNDTEIRTKKMKDPLVDVSNEQINLFVDNYCQANPLKELSSAALALYVQLLRK